MTFTASPSTFANTPPSTTQPLSGVHTKSARAAQQNAAANSANVSDFIKAGSDIITFHYEAQKELTLDIIKEIKSSGVKVGLSIKPQTSTDEIREFIPYLDLVLIMTVEPGFGGQKFMHECVQKIADIKEFARLYKRDGLYIQVDGGINEKTANICKNLGANSLVAGSYIFNSSDINQAIASLL